MTPKYLEDNARVIDLNKGLEEMGHSERVWIRAYRTKKGKYKQSYYLAVEPRTDFRKARCYTISRVSSMVSNIRVAHMMAEFAKRKLGV